MPHIPVIALDPTTVKIMPNRQRQSNVANVGDLVESLRNTGKLINPISIRYENGEPVLIAGERRLRAHIELGWKTIDCRNFTDLSEEDAEVIELEENIKRSDLHWRDYVIAIGRIHSIMTFRQDGWTIEQTATMLSLTPQWMRKVLHVHDAIDSPRIANSDGVDHAYNVLARFAERKAADIVSNLIQSGAEAFASASVASVVNASVASATSASPPPANGANVANAASDDSAEADDLFGVANAPLASATVPPPAPVPAPVPTPTPAPAPIICANFLNWLPLYTGPKFTLIHCDFPYGNYKGDDSSGAISNTDVSDFYENHEQVYWDLLDGLCANLDRIMSYSAHLVFWFNMNYYTQTVAKLRATGLMVHDHPFIWHKTPGGGGGLGVVPGTAVTHPRRTYDTALFAVRGNRPMAKPGLNSYAAPTAGNKIHPSQKPEPMLRHFLSMLVDETTTVLDPTCGSGAALRACEDLGAKSILGLELDPNYAKTALTATLQARVMRSAGKLAAK